MTVINSIAHLTPAFGNPLLLLLFVVVVVVVLLQLCLMPTDLEVNVPLPWP